MRQNATLWRRNHGKTSIFAEIVAVLVNGVDNVIIFTDVRTSAINDVTTKIIVEMN